MAERQEPGELDAAARHAIKLAPEEVARWLLPTLSADLTFVRWLDTEMIAFPGEPRRRCDTVAELVSRSGKQAPWALVIEVEARPRSAIRVRLPEYQLRVLRRVRHGPHGREPYQVAGALIVLKGEQRGMEIQMELPDTSLRFSWAASVMNEAKQDAKEVMAQIKAKKLGLGILPWVALMSGADDPEAAEEWARLILLETDEERRRDYVGVARLFAEWTRRTEIWKKALEGWDMETWKSETIETWRNQGDLRTKRADLIEVMELKFKCEVPADMRQRIQQTTDITTLARWLKQVMLLTSLDDVRREMQQPTGQSTNGAAGS
jgi:hypothetical protein